MKVIIVGGVAGGASCAARLRRLDEKARDPDGRARAVRVVRELRAALPRRRRDREGIEPARGERSSTFRDQFAIEVRTNCEAIEISPDEEDRGPAQRRDRRGDHRVLRQAGAVARRGVDPPAAARHRPARHLPGAHRARRPRDPRVDREGHAVPRRHGPLLRLPDGAAEDARGGHRRRLHRPGDGREPGPSRLRRHAGRDARPGPGAAGPGDGAPRRGPPAAARRARWRSNDGVAGFEQGDERRARGADEVGQDVSRPTS